jgi:hypothetical protein
MSTPICTNCRFHRASFTASRYDLCAHPSVLSPVDGKVSAFCTSERLESDERCGPSGRNFESKPRRATNLMRLSHLLYTAGFTGASFCAVFIPHEPLRVLLVTACCTLIFIAGLYRERAKAPGEGGEFFGG